MIILCRVGQAVGTTAGLLLILMGAMTTVFAVGARRGWFHLLQIAMWLLPNAPHRRQRGDAGQGAEGQASTVSNPSFCPILPTQGASVMELGESSGAAAASYSGLTGKRGERMATRFALNTLQEGWQDCGGDSGEVCQACLYKIQNDRYRRNSKCTCKKMVDEESL